MSSGSVEREETLAAEVLVSFRRLGQNRVHFALVMPDTLVPAAQFGVPCTLVTSPVVAWCGRTLRGNIVEIPTESLDGWRKQGHVCRECQMVARFALRLCDGDDGDGR